MAVIPASEAEAEIIEVGIQTELLRIIIILKLKEKNKPLNDLFLKEIAVIVVFSSCLSSTCKAIVST